MSVQNKSKYKATCMHMHIHTHAVQEFSSPNKTTQCVWQENIRNKQWCYGILVQLPKGYIFIPTGGYDIFLLIWGDSINSSPYCFADFIVTKIYIYTQAQFSKPVPIWRFWLDERLVKWDCHFLATAVEQLFGEIFKCFLGLLDLQYHFCTMLYCVCGIISLYLDAEFACTHYLPLLCLM